MALTPSTMLELGSRAPDFALENAINGRRVSLRDFEDSPALLVMFICNHCPYVQHIRSELGRLARDYAPLGLAVAAINSNSLETHPQDGPDAMKELAVAEGWEFPYLFDETQSVAKVYKAACTPDFFLFDGDRRLVYRGQFDDSRPGNAIPVTGADLRAAIDAVLAGQPVSSDQKPSMGCNIKWTPGNEPGYA
ncbi:MAG: thioredoxin family protein [Gemmatimonadales bacterium]